VCAICLQNLSEEHTSKLPCGHEFHSDCIITSLMENAPICPTCRDDRRRTGSLSSDDWIPDLGPPAVPWLFNGSGVPPVPPSWSWMISCQVPGCLVPGCLGAAPSSPAYSTASDGAGDARIILTKREAGQHGSFWVGAPAEMLADGREPEDVFIVDDLGILRGIDITVSCKRRRTGSLS